MCVIVQYCVVLSYKKRALLERSGEAAVAYARPRAVTNARSAYVFLAAAVLRIDPTSSKANAQDSVVVVSATF